MRCFVNVDYNVIYGVLFHAYMSYEFVKSTNSYGYPKLLIIGAVQQDFLEIKRYQYLLLLEIEELQNGHEDRKRKQSRPHTNKR